MKLFDAINASPVEAAFRYLSQIAVGGPDEANLVLIDKEQPKAFLALGNVAWIRKKLQLAKQFDDWRPALTRDPPDLTGPDVVTQLGRIESDLTG